MITINDKYDSSDLLFSIPGPLSLNTLEKSKYFSGRFKSKLWSIYFLPFNKVACTIELIIPTWVSQISNIAQTWLSSNMGLVLGKKKVGLNSFKNLEPNGSPGYGF